MAVPQAGVATAVPVDNYGGGGYGGGQYGMAVATAIPVAVPMVRFLAAYMFQSCRYSPIHANAEAIFAIFSM